MYPLLFYTADQNFGIWEPEFLGKDSCRLAGKRAAAHCESLHRQS